MDDKTKKYCDSLVDIWKKLQKVFRRDNDKIVLAGSTVFVCAGVEPDIAKIQMCEDFVKNNTEKNSPLRSMFRIPFVCKMSLQDKPGIYFDKVKHICELLGTYKWLTDDSKMASAMIIADCSDGDAHDDASLRYYLNETDKVLNELKERFGKKLSEKDYPYAAMLAASDYEIEPLVDDVMGCYERLAPTFKDGGVCKGLSYILALGVDDPAAKKNKLIELFGGIEQSEMRFGRGQELIITAPLSLLETPANLLAEDFLETEVYMKMDKHCRGYTMKPNIRNLYTALMIFEAHRNDFESLEDFAFSDIVSIMIQLEAAVITPSSSSILSFGGAKISN
ncbi:MAG: DUF4003 family protein [Firmicutes bacterium]|nr:DUF4003 family protein [Bacillota bacterium]